MSEAEDTAVPSGSGTRVLRTGTRKEYSGLDEGPLPLKEPEQPMPKKRGRPPGSTNNKDGPKKKIGRPPKLATAAKQKPLEPPCSDEVLAKWRSHLDSLPDDDDVQPGQTSAVEPVDSVEGELEGSGDRPGDVHAPADVSDPTASDMPEQVAPAPASATDMEAEVAAVQDDGSMNATVIGVPAEEVASPSPGAHEQPADAKEAVVPSPRLAEVGAADASAAKKEEEGGRAPSEREDAEAEGEEGEEVVEESRGEDERNATPTAEAAARGESPDLLPSSMALDAPRPSVPQPAGHVEMLLAPPEAIGYLLQARMQPVMPASYMHRSACAAVPAQRSRCSTCMPCALTVRCAFAVPRRPTSSYRRLLMRCCC
jgi:hypothetical protein